MKAVLCTSLDGPDGLVISDLPTPKPTANQVVVRVEAVGLNFMDTLITRGAYQDKPDLPFSPGGEVAGQIREVGRDVVGFTVGERVSAYVGWGGARELLAIDAEKLVPVPTAVGIEMAAGLNITYGTAMHGLLERASVQPAETVVVLGASGGAGLAAVEVATLIGARVIAVGTSEAKLAACRDRGAEILVADRGGGDLKVQLRDITEGVGPNVIYDCIGAAFAEQALRALAWGGRYLVVGFAAGDIPKLPMNIVLLKGCDILGVSWGQATRRSPATHRAHMETVFRWVESGRLKPHVHAVLPLDRASEAIQSIADRKITGKLILQP
ncbi:MAG: NADPH:quinone oxidoreductase family protein [Pseudomonadota bacterium]